jgi:excisionase family DNA binding protein
MRNGHVATLVQLNRRTGSMESPAPPDRLLTIYEAAERSSVSQELIRKAISSGEVSYISLGFGRKQRGGVRIRESALEKWWRSKETKTLYGW